MWHVYNSLSHITQMQDIEAGTHSIKTVMGNWHFKSTGIMADPNSNAMGTQLNFQHRQKTILTELMPLFKQTEETGAWSVD